MSRELDAAIAKVKGLQAELAPIEERCEAAERTIAELRKRRTELWGLLTQAEQEAHQTFHQECLKP